MALFQSSPAVSPFIPNQLFDATSGQALQRGQMNDLMLQDKRQEVASTDQEMVARASAYIDGLPADQKPGAYASAVRDLQSRGFALKAPEQYPGDDVIKRLAAMGTPSKDILAMGMNRDAAAAYGRSLGLGGGAVAPGASAAPAGASLTPFVAKNLPPGITPEEDQIVRTVYGEAAGEPPEGQRAVAAVIRNRVVQSGRPTSDVIFAPNQFEPWNNAATRAKLEALDPASPDYQRILANIRQGGDPTGGATHFYSPTAQAALGRQAPAWAQGTPTVIGNHQFYNLGYTAGSGAPGALAGGAPGTGGGVAARTGGVDVAGPGAPASGGAVAPAAAGLPPLLPSGLTADQEAQVNVRLSGRNPDINAIGDDVRAMQARNIQVRHQAAEDARQATNDAYQRQKDAAAEAERQRKAAQEGVPPGYRMVNGKAERIPGLPVDENVSKQDNQKFQQENTLRDEFGKLTSDFRTVQTSYENIRSAAKAKDGAGDMSLLYSYVKLLDPTSVVRESEFGAAAASGSFGERVQGAAERILSGARMPDSLRDSFIREAGNLYGNQLRAHNSIADQYEALAKRNGLDPEKVVTRFARPQEAAPQPAAQPVGPPKVGAVEGGYKFKGGNPADPNNWQKVQ